MPCYDYYCKRCDESFEEIRRVDNRDDEAICSSCGKRAERMFSKTSPPVSEKTVWEALRDGTLPELLESVPDEFYNWVQGVKTDLEAKYYMIEYSAKHYFVDLGDRKTNALHYQKFKYPGILFNMLDGRDYSQTIWKLVRPEVTRVFKMVGEDAN